MMQVLLLQDFLPNNFVIDSTFGAVSISQCCHTSEMKEVLIKMFSTDVCLFTILL